MKKTLLTLAVIAIAQFSYAQFSSSGGNTTTSDNVGIGTASPSAKLHLMEDASTGATALKLTNRNNNQTWGVAVDVDAVDDKKFMIYDVTGSIPRFVINTSGNVGIGTTSPAQRLTIPITSNADGISLGTNSSLSAGSFAFVGITGADGTFNSGNLTGSDNGSAGMAIIHTSGGVGNSAELAFVTHNNGVDSRERVRIDRLGNVGMGTTSPGTQLDIQGNGTNALPLYLRAGTNLGTAGQTVALQFRESTGATPTGAITNITQDGTHIGLAFSTYNSGIAEVMRILGNGNVLIGKTSQNNTGYILDVNGSARANEVVVNTTGADFVFDNKYTLPKLSEVKSYIDENHHLPEVPSAAQMKKDGLNVGEMNTKLLQKVEELTLYAIEQKEEIEQLKKGQEELKAALAKLTTSNSK